jgi:hypothetical protein
MSALTQEQQDRLEELPTVVKVVAWIGDGPVLRAPDGTLRKLSPGGRLYALRQKVEV